MQCKYASFLSSAPSSTKSLIRSRKKKRQHKCLGKESYTMSDPRESFEEQGYILI
jgi:hypothetical protein